MPSDKPVGVYRNSRIGMGGGVCEDTMTVRTNFRRDGSFDASPGDASESLARLCLDGGARELAISAAIRHAEGGQPFERHNRSHTISCPWAWRVHIAAKGVGRPVLAQPSNQLRQALTKSSHSRWRPEVAKSCTELQKIL